MNRIFKNTFALALSLCLIFSFTACGNEAESDDTDIQTVEKEDIPQGDTSSEIVGAWDNDFSAFSFVFNDDGTFILSSMRTTETGTYVFNDGEITLTYDNVPEGQNERVFILNDSNFITEDGNDPDDYYYNVPIANYKQPETSNGLVGAWDNSSLSLSIIFNDDLSFELHSSGTVITGTYTLNGIEILMTDTTGAQAQGSFDDTVFYLNGYDGYFYTTTSPAFLTSSSTDTNTQDTSSEDTTSPSTDKTSADSVVGAWDNDTSGVSILFKEDGSFEMYSSKDPTILYSYYFYDSTEQKLGIMNEYSEEFYSVFDGNSFSFPHIDGFFYSVSDVGYRYSGDFPDSITGLWDSHEDESSLILHADGRFELHFTVNMLDGTYTYEPEYGTLVLNYNSEHHPDKPGYLDANGTLYLKYTHSDFPYQPTASISYPYVG